MDSFLSKTSTNLGLSIRDLMSGRTNVSGSKVANLGPAFVVSSTLLVLVHPHLALTEGYGDARWARYQQTQWPDMHHLRTSLVRVGQSRPRRVNIQAYTVNDSEPLRVDDSCIYLTARQNDRNPYHWIFETLPRLKCLDVIPELRKLPLLVCHPLTTFQRAFLDWMGVTNEIIVSDGRDVSCRNLFFPSIPSPPPLNAELLAWLRERVAGGQSEPRQPRRRILISRRDQTQGRRVINEGELAVQLAKLGFECLVLGEMAPAEQVRAFREAEIVVLPHGAGGAHLLFAPPDCRVIELQSPGQFNAIYFALGRMLGQRFSVVIGDRRGRSNDYFVDPGELMGLVTEIDAELAAERATA